jgi:hypothetical protein
MSICQDSLECVDAILRKVKRCGSSALSKGYQQMGLRTAILIPGFLVLHRLLECQAIGAGLHSGCMGELPASAGGVESKSTALRALP